MPLPALPAAFPALRKAPARLRPGLSHRDLIRAARLLSLAGQAAGGRRALSDHYQLTDAATRARPLSRVPATACALPPKE